MIEVANEEREHVGAFDRLHAILTGDADKYLGEGREAKDELAAETASS